jgi:ferredoxin
MTYVITQKCAGTCDTACVDVCPVDCIHGPVDLEPLRELDPAERARAVVHVQLYIDPADCIECGVCVPECPVAAIYLEDNLPPEFAGDLEANALFFRKLRAGGAG